ncbi:DUF2797 domain-containing protein [Luteibaculum oceani]|uniref:DUF2797 domain-containing protein n=2 Tax=Luteibaculum oceani TaxID=1294296 RepID=A0A5C6VBF7_9FLAO|nr:DUF2797 domain-containing protein [Luteibaculum oceani]
MQVQGLIKKMKVALQANEVSYYFPFEGKVPVNDWVGKEVVIRFSGQLNCINCSRETNKIFGEGLCYPCFRDAPQAAPCIIRPELCEAHLGKGRDVEWEEQHHNQPHIVYLALSSSVKVGVTREIQVPTRWIDQGANQAIILAEVPYRQLAGEIEVFLKDHYTDKTSWQAMVKNHVAEADLLEEKENAAYELPPELQDFVSDNDEVFDLKYPVIEFPTKAKSIKLDKMPEVQGKLAGIKGQYWLFSDGRVFNWRNHSGYNVEVSQVEESSKSQTELF